MSTSIAAVVERGTVVNLIIVSVDDNGEPAYKPEGQTIVPLPEDTDVMVGWTYNDGELSPPTDAAHQDTTPAPPQQVTPDASAAPVQDLESETPPAEPPVVEDNHTPSE